MNCNYNLQFQGEKITPFVVASLKVLKCCNALKEKIFKSSNNTEKCAKQRIAVLLT
jgi:hypothetical protein